MLYEQMGWQGGSFWAALLSGVGLSLLYDGVRFLFVFLHGKAKIPGGILFLYFFFCAIVTELLALAMAYGRIRFYLLAGMGIGAACYWMSFGVLTDWIARRLHRIGFSIWKQIFCRFFLGFCAFWKRQILLFRKKKSGGQKSV